ncbi:dihydroneopterin triphosphate diphosphatase [Alteromonas pelagimontana]|uniref:Dihydroneopterin triphosphate diphosphatase n=1 Tax=Alteromonas pelagimontana TaxID=1858656 RepID=A0A6M4MCF4_9ALTE|nr:dihydroneopterin triphosphate diphosphatase [Alteromonas pelagimontana]QJR79826.1 dihydroneopterin triphosphate diphosphatase [Alteromonas pelagimontana]
MHYKRPESVLVVLYDQNHRVLLLQRQDDPLFWQSVTGSMEAGERPIETAYREVAEETGIQLSTEVAAIKDCQRVNRFVIRPRWRYRYPPDTLYNTEHVFSAKIDSTTPLLLTEHLAYEWLPAADAVKRLWSASNRQAVEEFVPGAI